MALQSDFSIEINVEHTDGVRYADDAYRHKLIDMYRHKYSHPKMDLIIGVDDEAVDMLLDFGEKVFPEIPIVLITAERKTFPRDLLKPNMTSLLWGADIRANVELIGELLPQTRHIFVAAGAASPGPGEISHGGRFREDLFYRLNVFAITVPPLRHRVEGIPLLTRFFVEKASKRLGKSLAQRPKRIISCGCSSLPTGASTAPKAPPLFWI